MRVKYRQNHIDWRAIREPRPRLRHAIGHDGGPLMLSDLPPGDYGLNARRPGGGGDMWGERQKANVALAVRGGLLSVPECLERYSMHLDELLGWYEGLRAGDLRQPDQRRATPRSG